MKNKTKVVRFRVTEEQRKQIEEICGGDMSAYIIKKMFEGVSFKKPDVKGEGIEIEVEAKPAKCESPGCVSMNTQLYNRSTGTFWLCDTHKP